MCQLCVHLCQTAYIPIIVSRCSRPCPSSGRFHQSHTCARILSIYPGHRRRQALNIYLRGQATKNSCSDKQVEGAKEFVEALEGLVKLFIRAEQETESAFGLWGKEDELSLADVMVAPCASLHPLRKDSFAVTYLRHDLGIFRATNALVYYRGFILPEGPRFHTYVNRVLKHSAFKRTCSTEELYIDSYER